MKKSRLHTIILIFIFIAGVVLLLYPAVSDYWNSFHQSRAVAQYAEDVANLDEEEYEAMLQAAEEYNVALAQNARHYNKTEEEQAEYESLLNVSGDGILGIVEIPTIDCTLPIYHGVDESVLQIAVGHIEWTSLPIGGPNTHAVISGHRGLPSAKLFTNLDRLVEGDIFLIRVLNETLTYEVDQILIVEPEDLGALQIEAGQDLCTLVTCTPYGINSHRLLVRGHRIENLAESNSIRVTADALQVKPVLMAPLIASPMLLALLIYLLVTTRKRKGQLQIFKRIRNRKK